MHRETGSMIVTVTLLASTAGLLFIFYRKRKWQMKKFERLGIPGPKPHWLSGNLNELYHNPHQEPHDVYMNWTARYGKTFGYFEGSTPHYVTSDVDLVQAILVKNFSKFNGRKLFSFMSQKDRDQGHIVMANGPRWKRLRAIINPTFSTAKLKQVVPTLVDKVENLERNLSVAGTDPVEVLEFFQRLTLAVIGNVAFGMNVDPQNNPNDEYLRTCRSLFNAMTPRNKPYFMKVVDMLPELRSIFRVAINNLIALSPINGYFRWIGANLDKVIEERRNQVRRPDLLQLMLDAEVDSVTDLSEGSSSGHGRHKLTNEELRQQAIIFMAAGYETTSTTLAFVTQMLATHPEKQQKLMDEIDAVAPRMTQLTYEDIQGMEYLDMVVCETMRMYPTSGMAVVRECFEDCVVNGIPFEKGTMIQVDVWSVHFSKDVWGSDADQFIPERFSKLERQDRHPMAWLAFGAGPKNCLGQKFAVMEVKFVFCYLLQRYTFERCAKTQDPLPLKNNMATAPRDGVTVRMVPRLFPDD